MTHEEGVLNIIKELNGLKEKRKKIQQELKAIEDRRVKEIEEPKSKLEGELKGIASSILFSPYVHSRDDVLIDDRYDREYPVTWYHIGKVLVGGGLYGDTVYTSAAKQLEEMSEEERIKLVRKNMDPQIQYVKSSVEENEKTKNEIDEKLAGLYAERAVTPWYAFAKKRKLEKEIEYLEKELKKVEEYISNAKKRIKALEEEQNANKDMTPALKAIEELIEKLKLYDVKDEELKSIKEKLKENDQVLRQAYQGKQKILTPLRQDFLELVVGIEPTTC